MVVETYVFNAGACHAMGTVLFFLFGNNFCLGHVLSYLCWLVTCLLDA